MTAQAPQADERDAAPSAEGQPEIDPPPQPEERPPQQADLRCTICGLPSCWR
jgi:hypothetical protein